MFDVIHRVVPPPVFEDEDRDRTGRLLYDMLAMCLGLLLVLTPLQVIQPDPLPRMIPNFVMMLVIVGLYGMARRGYLTAAVVALPSILWIVITLVVVLFGGVTSSAFNLYVIVILMAGVLISTLAAIIFLGLTTAFGFFVMYLEQIGRLPASLGPSDSNVGTLLSIITYLAIVIFLVDLSNRGLKAALARAKQNERELSQANQHLSESEARWRAVVDHAPLTIVLTDLEGEITFANVDPRAQPRAIGRTVYDFAEAEKAAEGREITRKVLETRESIIYEAPAEDLSGNPRWYQFFLAPIVMDDDVRELVYLVNDITDRKQAEAALVEANAELQKHRDNLEEMVAARTAELAAANRELKALSKVKDEFVANVSHELFTPITNMMLHLRLTGMPVANPDHHLDIIRRETRRLRIIIDDLLQLTRLDQDVSAVEFEMVDINELVSVMHTDRLMLAQERGLTLDLDLSEGLPAVTGDPDLLSQTLSIMLTNALNYTPGGGQVRLRTVRQQYDGDTWVGFSVTDTGPGIPEDEQAELFKRFSRGQAGHTTQYPGTGLGLAIAHEVVTRHSGRIEVQSPLTDEGGTTFNVWLPAMN